MKKLIIILFLICLICGGCSSSNSTKMRETYPHVTLESSNFYSDDVYIPVPQGYTFNLQNYYDEIKTEEGYDIIIHLKKELVGK